MSRPTTFYSRRQLLLSGSALLAICWILVFRLLQTQEPRFQGHNAEYWIQSWIDGKEHSNTVQALRILSSRTVPLLTDSVSRRRGVLTQAVQFIGEKTGLWRSGWTDRGRVRASAAAGLGVIGHEAANAIPTLIRALRDNDAAVCASAATALGRIGSAAVPALLDGLGDSNRDVQVYAMHSLAEMEPKPNKAIPMISSLILDKTPEMRRSASYALSFFGTNAATATPILLEALTKETDARARVSFALALWRITKSNDLPVSILAGHIQDADKLTRKLAIAYLGDMGTGALKAAPLVSAALTDPDEGVRVRATNSLRAMGILSIP